MNNLESYKQVFIETLNVNEDELSSLAYQSKATWDSVGHMALISVLEQTFDIMMDTDDIIDLSSFEKGKEILIKYGVEL